MKKRIIAGAVLGGLALASIGGVAGWTLAPRSAAAAPSDQTRPIPCNLGIEWDDDANMFATSYAEPAYVTELEYGRLANQSCDDGHILLWQQARHSQGLDHRVCRPIVQDDPMGNIMFVGCTDPSEVVDGEPR
ncbi:MULTISPECIES: hypothetical protein [Microbacterium]|uniref:hypothetical protein n=1 Tax=Microbacterium TaxID=33882 RepID=UPI00106F8407|nr:hypothetical protein [Microbacterium sp. MEC084]MCD1267816.1 hypothetical protein [Microbacterium sp. MEC084]